MGVIIIGITIDVIGICLKIEGMIHDRQTGGMADGMGDEMMDDQIDMRMIDLTNKMAKLKKGMMTVEKTEEITAGLMIVIREEIETMMTTQERMIVEEGNILMIQEDAMT